MSYLIFTVKSFAILKYLFMRKLQLIKNVLESKKLEGEKRILFNF